MKTVMRLMVMALGVTMMGAVAFASGGPAEPEEEAAAEAAMMKLPPSDVWQWDTLADYESATGNKITKFGEAPMLAARVRAGELPPVEERLPDEPLVLNVLEGIGQYGGTLISADIGGGGDFNKLRALVGTVQTANRGPGNPHQLVPYIHKGFDFSADQKTLTMYLRKGMKWSDGQLYTAEDVMFWLEDWHMHPDYSDSWVKTNFGPIARGEKVDEYTVRIHYSKPYPTLPGWYEWWGGWYPRRYPKHYLAKYHPKYNPDAEKLAKEEGHESWVQAFNAHNAMGDIGAGDIEVPVLAPWLHAEAGTTYATFERNPYHFAIDPAGNQLPYLDRLRIDLVADQEAYNLKAISGEATISGRYLTVNNLPLYKENAEKGDYEVLLWPRPAGAEAFYGFNMTHKDPVSRTIFQDIRFRQAMSLAINRDEINEVLYFGMAVPRQAAMDPENSFYKEEWATRFAEYDPERAKQLLDQMGLKYDREGMFRLRPDGKTLEVQILVPFFAALVEITELVVEYWQEVGVKVDMRAVDQGLSFQRSGANEHDVAVWLLRRTNESKGYMPANKFLSDEGYYAMPWYTWWQSGGEKGEEPPQEFKDYFELADRWFVTADKAERDRIATQLFDFASEKVLVIGTVGYAPVPVIPSNKLRNFPRDIRFYGDDAQYFRDLKPDTWFLRQ